MELDMEKIFQTKAKAKSNAWITADYKFTAISQLQVDLNMDQKRANFALNLIGLQLIKNCSV